VTAVTNLQISPEELQQRFLDDEPTALLDVRELEENEFVSLPNSILIPLGELSSRLDELESFKDRDIVVYCHHGIRSLQAIGILRHHGFLRLRNLAGGIDRFAIQVAPELPRY